MEKKNKKMLLVIGVLLLFGSISFAYFVGTSLFEGTGSKTEAITASIKGATVNVDGGLTFNDLDILPGHQTISSIKVTATGNNELIPYNLIWNGTNSLNTPLKFKVYKTSKEVEVSISCEKKTKVENGYQILNEECSIFNLDKLGSVVSSGTIETAQNTTKVILAKEEFITATNDGMSVYYYVILEYPNLDEEQNEDMGGNFNGTVTVEESNAKPDINILAVKIEGEDGTYQDSEDIPQEGYRLNEERSVCSNGATPTGFAPNITVNNLTKNGTNCYLYFDKTNAKEVILKNVVLNKGTQEFSQIADTDEGLCISKKENEEGDNDGDTYYFRGAVENNYVKFAGKYWRIIRINGDGTIRLIYQGPGVTSTETGAQITLDSKNGFAFNENQNNNMYVGFRYTSNKVHGAGTESTILNVLNTWYDKNIGNNAEYVNKIDENAGFCGDRTSYTDENGTTLGGGTGTTTTYYGANIRLVKYKMPSLKCLNEDLYTKTGATKGNKTLTNPIGLITADEAIMAGGVYNKTNQSYYLNSGYHYWTMSPAFYNNNAFMIVMVSNGTFDRLYTSTSWIGVRPVINLRADVELTGTGTSTDPYIVFGAE